MSIKFYWQRFHKLQSFCEASSAFKCFISHQFTWARHRKFIGIQLRGRTHEKANQFFGHNRNTQSTSGCFDVYLLSYFLCRDSPSEPKSRKGERKGRKKLKSMWGTWRSWLRCKVFRRIRFDRLIFCRDANAISLLIHQTVFRVRTMGDDVITWMLRQ